MCVQAQLACWRRLVPQAGVGFFYLTEVFRLRESELFFLRFFLRCACRRGLSAGAGLLLMSGWFFYLTEVFRSRESELFFLQVFSRCACRRSLPACAGLPLRPGQALPFFSKRKEAKIRQRGEFRFSPPWNPLSTTKGAAFGNREKLPLWFCFTHRHSLRVKRVRKESFHVCNWYGKCS